MKKKLFIVICGLILLVVGGMFWYIVKTKYQERHLNIDTLPNMSLFTSNDEAYYIPNTDKATVIVFFKSDCQFCLNEAAQIAENDSIFTKAQVYFVSAEAIEYFKMFESAFCFSQIIFLHDKAKDFCNALHVSKLPSIYIFASDRKFVERFVGFKSIKQIISHIPSEQPH